MKHNWKVGDAYTTKRWKELHILGVATQVMESTVVGTEIHSPGKEHAAFHLGAYRDPADLIPLIPEPVVRLGQTINKLYATVDEATCRNQEADCHPPCPEHFPVDAFEDPATVRYE